MAWKPLLWFPGSGRAAALGAELAGATVAHALQRCAEAAGKTALPHRGLFLARSTLPPPLVATHLCSFPPQGVFHSSIITQTN